MDVQHAEKYWANLSQITYRSLNAMHVDAWEALYAAVKSNWLQKQMWVMKHNEIRCVPKITTPRCAQDGIWPQPPSDLQIGAVVVAVRCIATLLGTCIRNVRALNAAGTVFAVDNEVDAQRLLAQPNWIGRWYCSPPPTHTAKWWVLFVSIHIEDCS